MRVLHVIEGLAPSLGGLSRAAANLSEAMARSGAKIEIVTTTSSDGGSLFQPTGVEVHAVARKFVNSWGYAPRLSQAIKTGIDKADLIHLHGLWLYPQFIASRASWRARKPYIVSPHGMLNVWALAQGKVKKRVYRELIEQRTLQRAAAIHAVSESEAQDIRRLGFCSRIVTIPNGVNQAEFAQLPSSYVFKRKYPLLADKTIFLFLGRIHPKKGVALLAKAFSEVARACPDVALVIAGPDEVGYQNQMEECMIAEGAAGRYVFTGLLEDQERVEALAAADVFVLPSHSEGFPLAPIEALAAGLPVIMTEECHIPGIDENGAGLIVRQDTTALREAILKLATDPKLRKKMGSNGRRLALSNYKWENIAARMTELYREVLNAHSSSLA